MAGTSPAMTEKEAKPNKFVMPALVAGIHESTGPSTGRHCAA
jgi:hypothetical protein